MDEKIDILAVIPCLNEEKHLDALLSWLSRVQKTLPMRIVVADGGSTDESVNIVNRYHAENADIICLHNPQRLQSAGINLAVQEYGESCTYLIRIDAHADYPEDFCHQLVAEIDKQNADSVTVAMNTVGITPFQRAVAAAQNSKLGNGGSSHRLTSGEGKWVDHGHHAIMLTEAFNAVGGYNAAFSHNEDAELDTRLRQAGYKIWLTNSTLGDYYPRSTPYALFRQYVNYGQGRVRTLLLHRQRPRIRQCIPVGVLPAAVLALLTPVHGIFAFPLLCWMAICLGYGALLAKKSNDATIAMSGIAAMIMHFAWSVGFWKGVMRYGRASL
ncbi:MAG: glycosyltransferase family 2 protein [Alphaproteobacteria bacterium]|nr:glycosyltransferase family 2 protein [Alphaproteobacteria bacterium]